jgi:hypothetical protein
MQSLTLHMAMGRSSDAILALLYTTQFQTDTKNARTLQFHSELRITTSTVKESSSLRHASVKPYYVTSRVTAC